MEIIDLAEVARLTHRAGGLFVVDNVFATPLLQKPLVLGADVVVYSATKHIDGQGRCLGGHIRALERRVEGQCRTAAAIAGYLDTHPKITRVLYPGLPSHPQYELARRQMKQGGGLVCFDGAGAKEASFRFLLAPAL